MSIADGVYRVHLGALGYPVPTGLSKLADQVTKFLFAWATTLSFYLYRCFCSERWGSRDGVSPIGLE